MPLLTIRTDGELGTTYNNTTDTSNRNAYSPNIVTKRVKVQFKAHDKKIWPQKKHV